MDKASGIGSGALPRALGPLIRALAGVLRAVSIPVSALCALSAVILLPVGVFDGMLIVPMFEAVVVLASVTAFLTLRGRFERGPGLSLLCCGGAIGALGLLAESTLVSRVLGAAGQPLVVAGVNLGPAMLARVGVGALLIATGAFMVWARRPERSAAYLIRSAITLGAAVLIVLLTPVPKPSFLGPLDRIASVIASVPPAVGFVLAVVAFFIALGLVASGGHCLIRSFEVGRLEGPTSENGSGRTPSSPAPPA